MLPIPFSLTLSYGEDRCYFKASENQGILAVDCEPIMVVASVARDV